MSAKTPLKRFHHRLAMLNRRADFLKQRIAEYKGGDPSRDKEELAALAWAIQVIEENPLEALEVIRFSERSLHEKPQEAGEAPKESA